MKMKKMYMPTLRDTPSEAVIPSHQLILRAALARRISSGVYAYLPLGYRVLRKVENIVREGMDKFGTQEVHLPILSPRELWEQTKRWEEFGPEMMKVTDRAGRDFCLGPTHEETITDLVVGELISYKQMPINLYHIQNKYRDELRPRYGFMRTKEFVMKDAYSFDIDEESMKAAYYNQKEAYKYIFDKLELNYTIVDADSGAMGGDGSQEFVALTENGEGIIVYCPENDDYSASEEKAEVVLEAKFTDEEEKEMEKIETINITTIDDLEEFLNIEPERLAKSLMYNVKGTPVLVIVPGNRDLNETKLANHLKVSAHDLEMADDDFIINEMKAHPGYTGPVGVSEKTRIIVDSRIVDTKNLVTGANEIDYHLKNVNYGRDFTGEIADDLLLIEEGDICPVCNKPLAMQKGMEVGHIFMLGTKYSESLDLKVLDKNGKEVHPQMGCYGIGVSRIISAVIEQNYDENGIIWPLIIAPYHVIITLINDNDQDQLELAGEIYEKLEAMGVEVLLDNRDERPGVKFNDRDLIGIPIRITVGRGAKDRIVELSTRSEGENKDTLVQDIYQEIENIFKENNMII